MGLPLYLLHNKAVAMEAERLNQLEFLLSDLSQRLVELRGYL